MNEVSVATTNMRDVELRKLSKSTIAQLSRLLEMEHSWKELMAVVPEECREENPLKYTDDHSRLIEDASRCQQRPSSEIFLEEWGCSGRNRPTVAFLLRCLLKAELYRAADFVAVELLNESPPARPKTGPAAAVELFSASPSPPTTVLEPSAPSPLAALEPSAPPPSEEYLKFDINSKQPIHVPYSELERATGNFDESKRLGIGAGGSVYSAYLPNLGELAIKRLHKKGSSIGLPIDPQEQFLNEVMVLAKLSHENLLPLIGYSKGGPCIVYRFMKNGSLLDKLALKKVEDALSWRQRLEIAIGAARGLDYLHSFSPKALVHRDVKSANILLDADLIAKLGDFGMAREGARAMTSQSEIQTETVVGTSVYMALEAYEGDVSVKLDVYSFGVVILELLTGLPPLDDNREGGDLITHLQGKEYSKSLLDSSAGEWPVEVGSNLYDLAEQCLLDKESRPLITYVLQLLEACL